jgi:hypothetical protein
MAWTRTVARVACVCLSTLTIDPETRESGRPARLAPAAATGAQLTLN